MGYIVPEQKSGVEVCGFQSVWGREGGGLREGLLSQLFCFIPVAFLEASGNRPSISQRETDPG